MQRTVTVSATADVYAIPDIASVSVGVGTEAATARDALTANSTLMEQVTAKLKSSGIDPKDIQTSALALEPRYDGGREGQEPKVTGYRAGNTVTVTVRDIDKLGQVLDDLVNAGANQVHGLEFSVSAAETLKDDARKEAMSNARRRAELLAAAGNAQVGDVISIAEDIPEPGPRPFAMGRVAMSKAVPIERGTEQLTARVTVTWALK